MNLQVAACYKMVKTHPKSAGNHSFPTNPLAEDCQEDTERL